MTAIIHEFQDLLHQKQTLNQQLWQSGSKVHDLMWQNDQLRSGLERSEEARHQAQNEIQELLRILDNEKEQRIDAKHSLEYASSRHEEIQRNYDHARDMNRCFVSLIDSLGFSGAGENLGVLLPKDFHIGSLLTENNDMKRRLAAIESQLADSNRDIEYKDQTIKDLQSELLTLRAEFGEVYSEEKGEGESEGESDGEHILGKRKRCEEDSI